MLSKAWAARSGRTAEQLQADFSKKRGEEHPYLEKDRAYRSEEDVFEHFASEERDALFGRPPATVWETLRNLAIVMLLAGLVVCGCLIYRHQYRPATE